MRNQARSAWPRDRDSIERQNPRARQPYHRGALERSAGQVARTVQKVVDFPATGFFNRRMKCALLFSLIVSSAFAQGFDVIIRNGDVYDGSGGPAQHVDVAIHGDRIAGLGDYSNGSAKTIVNATGLAVAPGFVNMLSWSTESLIQDGRSQSELRP